MVSVCLHHLSPVRQGHSPPQARDLNMYRLSAIYDIHIYRM